MDRTPQMIFKPVPWSTDVDADMERVMARDADPRIAPDWFERQAKEGLLTAYAVEVDGERVATFAGRIETDDAGREFVIVACGGRSSEVDITRSLLPVIEREALKAGCGSVRFHTLRKGLVRKAEGEGYHLAEYVMRKVLQAH